MFTGAIAIQKLNSGHKSSISIYRKEFQISRDIGTINQVDKDTNPLCAQYEAKNLL